MKNRLKGNKGFTLVELLATIAIISVVLGVGGYIIYNIIDNSQQKSKVLALANVKTAARIYVEENPEEVVWLSSTDQTYSCVKVETLISKDLLEKTAANNSDNGASGPNIKSYDYIIITKDSAGNIISEDLDTSNTCSANDTVVKIPTSKQYCKNPRYSGDVQTLTNTLSNGELFTFANNTGKDAGNYVVTAKLSSSEYYWSDGTKEDKTITCTIEKSSPDLVLDPNGINLSETTIVGELKTILTSNVDGTIKIKTSNKEYATASVAGGDDKITANTPKEIIVNHLSTRDTTTIITITVVPEDSNNYYTGSTTYTIGNISKNKVTIPNADSHCGDNLYYNGSQLTLTKTPDTGYMFFDNMATEVGTYTITAKLKFGYVWDSDEENDISDKTFQCEIENPIVKVTYNNNGGTGCTSTDVTYSKNYGTLCIPTKDDNMFVGWYTEKDGGDKITETSTVTNLNDHTIYAHWKKVGCSVSYTGTLGNNGWYKTTGNVKLNTTGFVDGDIKEYGLTTNTTQTFNGINSASQGNTTGTKWYGYVKDIYGHPISCNSTIKVDATAPTCTNSGGNTSWTNGNRTLTGTCSDTNGSGCVGNATKTFSSNINSTTESPGTIYDKAGNSTTCPSNQTVRIDKTAPSCSSSGGDASWTNGNRTLTGTCSDTGGSGCASNASKTFSSNTNTTTASPGTVKDNAGNTASCPANQTVKIDKTAPTCSSSGGNASWTNGNRTLTGTCSDSGGSGCAGNASKTFSSNINSTTESPGTVKDNAGNSTSCPANQTVKIDKTAPSCSSSGGNASWTNGNRTLTGTCSDSGGSGCAGNATKTFNTNTNTTTASPGTVKDNAGNTASCPANQTVRIDKTAPSCSSSGGNASWTNGNRTLTGTCSDSGGSGCAGNASKTFTTDINTTTASPGTVKDNAGNSTSCPSNQTVRIDKTPPTTPVITNPTNGNATSSPFSLTIYTKDTGSGWSFGQYRYDSNTAWQTDAWSVIGTDTYMTTPYSALRNENTYIRACDNVGNCSAEAPTRIHIISGCSYDNYTACPVYYTCASGAPDYYSSSWTWLRSDATMDSSLEIKVASASTIYVINTSSDFWYVRVADDATLSNHVYSPYLGTYGRYGYIYGSCLRNQPPNNNNFCTATNGGCAYVQKG